MNKKPKKRSLISPTGVLHPFIPDCVGDLLAQLGSSRPSAALLVYCPIMTLSAATMRPAYRKVSALTMDEWRSNGEANLSRCRPRVFGGTLLLGYVCRRKIRLILNIAGLIVESCI